MVQFSGRPPFPPASTPSVRAATSPLETEETQAHPTADTFKPIAAPSQPAPSLPKTNFWNSLALRFIGFDAGVQALLEPLRTINHSFDQHLGLLVMFTQRNPTAAARFFAERRTQGCTAPELLAMLACGDQAAGLAALDAIDRASREQHALLFRALLRIAHVRPYEAEHMLKRLFARADTHVRLDILCVFATSPTVGDRRALEEIFVGLMARSTPQERREEILPRLLHLLESPPPQEEQGRFKRGWLATMVKGWSAEAPELDSAPELRSRIRKIFS